MYIDPHLLNVIDNYLSLMMQTESEQSKQENFIFIKNNVQSSVELDPSASDMSSLACQTAIMLLLNVNFYYQVLFAGKSTFCQRKFHQSPTECNM